MLTILFFIVFDFIFCDYSIPLYAVYLTCDSFYILYRVIYCIHTLNRYTLNCERSEYVVFIRCRVYLCGAVNRKEFKRVFAYPFPFSQNPQF